MTALLHALDDITSAKDGWLAAFCGCGWEGPPCPDPVTAANFWGQHLLELRLDRLRVERDMLFDFYVRRAVEQWINDRQGDVNQVQIDAFEQRMRDSLTERLAERSREAVADG